MVEPHASAAMLVQSVPVPLLVILSAATVFGLSQGLYMLLTMTQRRKTREIREAAHNNGWSYSRRRWQGNPAAFRIDGNSNAGLPFKLTSGGSTSDNSRWAAELTIRFPTLGGETDIAITPRDADDQRLRAAARSLTPETGSRIAAISQAFAGAARFAHDAHEVPSGCGEFDQRYEVLVAPQHSGHSIVSAELAKRIVNWPTDALRVYSVVAWRDPFGFVFEARLPGPPNWATVSYFLSLANDLVARLPVAAVPSQERTLVDRAVARLLR